MIEFENVFPLPLEGVEAEQGQTAAAPLLFRGLPIAWVSVAKTKTVLVSECAFDGDDDTTQRTTPPTTRIWAAARLKNALSSWRATHGRRKKSMPRVSVARHLTSSWSMD